MTIFIRLLNTLWIMTYCAMITTAFGIQIFMSETPCPLCYLQRVGMLMVCTAALMNLQFGVKTVHYGLAILASLVGGFIASRQILLHICPGFPQFGTPFLGLQLFTWSFISFVCSILLTAVLLFFYESNQEKTSNRLNWFENISYYWLFLVAFGNIISTLYDCGLGICAD